MILVNQREARQSFKLMGQRLAIAQIFQVFVAAGSASY